MRRSTPPDVLVLTPDFPPSTGGIQHMLHRLAALSAMGSVVVCTCEAPGSAGFDPNQTFTIERIRVFGRTGRARLLLLNAGCLLSALRRPPSVVVSGHIVTAPAARVIRLLRGTSYVQIFYADEIAAHPRLAHFAAMGASRTVVISEYTRQLALDIGADARRLTLMPPGVDVPTQARCPRPDPRPTIITIARLQDRYKGHDVMLRAMPLVLERVPDARWLVVGDGPLRDELERVVATSELGEHVEMRGHVSVAERTALLDAADVFVMVSRVPPNGGGEGFGIVYLEAACRGLPSVAANVGGALDAVTEATGILVDPTDHVALAGAIVHLLVNPEDRGRLGAAARVRAAGFSWPLVAARFDRELRDVIEGIHEAAPCRE